MASATLQFPYRDVTTVQSAGVSPFFGGVQMFWTAEAQTRTETEPQFKMMELKAWELSGYTVSSNVLLQDAAFGLEKFLFTLFGQAIAWFEDYAFLQGNRKATSAYVHHRLRSYAVRVSDEPPNPPKSAIVRVCPAHWLPIDSHPTRASARNGDSTRRRAGVGGITSSSPSSPR
jgi:hypothetical protein